MTPEQLDKAIQFLLEQQAAIDAAFHRDREAAKLDRERTDARFRDVAKKQEEVLALVEANSKQIQANAEQVRTNSEQIRATSEQIQALNEQMHALKDACRDLLEHANYTDFRLKRLEN